MTTAAVKLDQTCPCGVTEAAGSYCTKCLAPTQESWLHHGKGNPDALRAYRAARAGSLTESPHPSPERPAGTLGL